MLRRVAVAAIVALGVPGVALAEDNSRIELGAFGGATEKLESQPPAPGYIALARLVAGQRGGRAVLTRSKTTIDARPASSVDVFPPRVPTSRAPDILRLTAGTARFTTDRIGARIDAGDATTTVVSGDLVAALVDGGVAISNHGNLPIRVKVGKVTRTVPAGHGLTSRGGKVAIAELPEVPPVAIGKSSGPAIAGAPLAAQITPADGVAVIAAIGAADGGKPIAAFESTGPSFAGGGLAAGRYTATLVARGAGGLESKPSAPVPFEVTTFDVVVPGSTEPAKPAAGITDEYKAPTLLPGTVVRLPTGECTAGAAMPARCPEGLGFELYQVEAKLAAQIPLSREAPTTLRIVVSTNAPSFDLGLVELTAEGATIQDRSTNENGISLTFAPASGETPPPTVTAKLGAATLATIELVVAAAAPPPPPPTVAVDKPEAKPGPSTRWELGGLIGGTLTDDENALGNAPTRAGVLDGGAIVGLRAGYGFTKALSAEAEATYSEPGFTEVDDHANVLSYRVHGRVFLSEGRIRPFAVLGFGGTYVATTSDAASNDADIEGYWGLGARFAYDERKSFRIDLRHRVGPGRVERTSNLFEASVGVSWRL